jgi:single-strand DNA-binding protein
MNKIQLSGRVGSDPEFRSLNDGGQVASFSLATEESWLVGDKREKRTTWHTIESFRPADIKVIRETITKGALVRVDGTLRTNTYTDKEGIKRYATKVLTSDWEHGIYLDPRGAAKLEAQAGRGSSLSRAVTQVTALCCVGLRGRMGERRAPDGARSKPTMRFFDARDASRRSQNRSQEPDHGLCQLGPRIPWKGQRQECGGAPNAT